MNRILLVCCVLIGCAAPPAPQAPAAPRLSFGQLHARLSEAGGYFDSDNLISNESSYLHALDELRARGVKGGAYVGVGPDQSFSYIAEIQPAVAFLIDIRRDNMLQHLMFKSLFLRSRNRMEFLAGLTGTRINGDMAEWTDRPIEQILAVFDTAQRPVGELTRVSAQVLADASQSGIPLTEEDIGTIRRFHQEFHQFGTSIRYSSKGRPIRLSYPTLKELALQTDRNGKPGSYLSTEERWRLVRDMHRADRIILVTGDLAGAQALRAVGDYIREQGLQISAFYTSNVEQYLFQFGTFDSFAANTVTLPFAPHGVMIRSFFLRAGSHTFAVPGYMSVQLVQPASEFVERVRSVGYNSYFELVH